MVTDLLRQKKLNGTERNTSKKQNILPYRTLEVLTIGKSRSQASDLKTERFIGGLLWKVGSLSLLCTSYCFCPLFPSTIEARRIIFSKKWNLKGWKSETPRGAENEWSMKLNSDLQPCVLLCFPNAGNKVYSFYPQENGIILF